MSEIINYAAFFAGVFILQPVLTPLLVRWFRSLREEERESISKKLRWVNKADHFMWRYIFWPVIIVIGVFAVRLFLTGKL